jgi:4-carboxymuconolactone decarboxylase
MKALLTCERNKYQCQSKSATHGHIKARPLLTMASPLAVIGFLGWSATVCDAQSLNQSEPATITVELAQAPVPAAQTAPHLIEDKDRELAIIAGLVVMGEKGRGDFVSHVNDALDSGARRQEIVELMATLSQCSGSPTAVNAIAAATKVFDARDASGKLHPGEADFIPGDAPVSEGNDARFINAQKTIQKVYPAGPNDDTYSRVRRIAPDFTRNFLTFFYNDLFLHPGLDLKTRELGIFASLASMGNVPLQLRWHTYGALNNGWTSEQLGELIHDLEPYIGYANAFQAALIVHDVVEERSHETLGSSAQQIGAPPESSTVDHAILVVHQASPRLISAIDQHAFTDLAPGKYFDQKERTLLSLSALITQGTANDLLRIEIRNALDSGLTESDIRELIKVVSKVAGGAVSSQAEAMVTAVVSERNKP